jgi:hypothetical protein
VCTVHDDPVRRGNLYSTNSGFHTQRKLPFGKENVVALSNFPFERHSTSSTVLSSSVFSVCFPPPFEAISSVDCLVPFELVSE